ncbi:CSEP0396 putative effector protein [Blumeria hordei DH14]|uniref:CSEP0396 putative effector protein n=1 Tax=Blumeria graminis f. sp. hordei (strain DH14) TaxID=546991 RepID=N1JIY5_BLUG1|nr:CSEP0396 putative effector protein [Blumeria hordei DH14]
MKFQSTALGVIISFYFYTIVATDGPGNYVCEKDYLPSDLISKYVKGSCNSIKNADISNRYPVRFDGSSHFGISDATLFATPTRVDCSKKNAGGCVGKNRIVIDSMCNLIGIVYVTNQSYKRCVKILDSIDESWSTSLTISNPVPKTYGYDCNFKIFILEDTLQYYRNLKQQISKLEKLKISKYINKIISTEFAEKEVYLWPIQSLDKQKTLYRIAVDKDKIFMGMTYRVGPEWMRCKQIDYVDPEPPRSLDPTKNSIGEQIFENVSAYKCDDAYISAITVNSHMQAACASIIEDQRKTVGFIGIWPIRREEFSITPRKKWNYYVKYDHECNFLGVHVRYNNSYGQCQKDESSLHPTKRRPALTCLNLFPH